MAILKKRFGNKQNQITKHMKALLGLEAVQLKGVPERRHEVMSPLNFFSVILGSLVLVSCDLTAV